MLQNGVAKDASETKDCRIAGRKARGVSKDFLGMEER